MGKDSYRLNRHESKSTSLAVTISVAGFLLLIIAFLVVALSNKSNANSQNANTFNIAASRAACEKTPQEQLYQQLLAQEQAPGASLTANYSAVVSSLAKLAPEVEQQNAQCELKYPTN